MINILCFAAMLCYQCLADLCRGRIPNLQSIGIKQNLLCGFQHPTLRHHNTFRCSNSETWHTFLDVRTGLYAGMPPFCCGFSCNIAVTVCEPTSRAVWSSNCIL